MFNKIEKLWIVTFILLTVVCYDIVILVFPEKTVFDRISWVFTVAGVLLGVLSPLIFYISSQHHSTEGLKDLLKEVNWDWITNVFEPSVGNAFLPLGMELQPSQVERQEKQMQLSIDKTIYQVFDEEARKSLLILGKPGAGKTTTLLKLLDELIKQAQARTDEKLPPIPVVFKLSRWVKQRGELLGWLASEMPTGFSKELGESWLKDRKILPLLDGLDEVQPADMREQCVAAINEFISTEDTGKTGIVVSCRQKEYDALPIKLKLKNAISLQPLRETQIEEYLKKQGEQLTALQNLLKQDPEMMKLANSPLMLSVMSSTYKDVTEEIKVVSGLAEKQSQLFNGYIKKMFDRKKESALYPQDQVINWLSWLAYQMRKHGYTDFLLENLQPDWLSSPFQLGYRLLVALLTGLLGGLGVWVVLQDASSLVIPVVSGAVVSLAIFASGSESIETLETLRWSWKKCRRELLTWLKKNLPYFLLLGVLMGGLLFVLNGKSWLLGLLVGLLVSLLFGLIYGLLRAGLENKIPDPKDRTVVNQGIISSFKNMVRFGIPIGLIMVGAVMYLTGFWEMTVISLLFWLCASVLVGFLMLGGDVIFYHYILRLCLYLAGHTPLNYVRFLEYADRLILLRKVGGRYMFTHELFLEHFAEKFKTSQPTKLNNEVATDAKNYSEYR